ncbi:glycoside hydrolase family 10 protein [Melioribacter sp. OK-6-Me]|uniref:glycoside hydrolase family 10 protein n=1 Tax=unclassified Melioribacter TaxID=2627329 RepID=UPI003EDA1BD9
MKKILLLLLIVAGIIPAESKRETRAVWLATNHRLDWPPPTYDIDIQKNALIEIFDSIKAKKLNTVYLQVRSNGTVMFNSSYDPPSPFISPQFDVLSFATKEAHKRGLEIHAWINAVQVFATNSLRMDSNHIAVRKPEWILKYKDENGTSLWLDIGRPEVRNYLNNLVMELIEKYDVDGVQLDYIRYPGNNINDDSSYYNYGNNKNRNEWRRNNVTELIEQIYKNIKSKKPYVKVGATPIGIYKNLDGMYGWEGYSQVYQDSREWLRRGILDYIAPQIYWSFEDQTSFDKIAREWVNNSYGKDVVVGIAAYKPEVKAVINKMVNFSRDIGAAGIAFFRYSNIKEIRIESFANISIPQKVNGMDTFNNFQLSTFTAEYSKKSSSIELRWQNNNSGSDINYYAIYCLPDSSSLLSNDYLIDLIPAENNSYRLEINRLKFPRCYFAITSLNRYWLESNRDSRLPSIDLFEGLSDILTKEQKPLLVKGNDGTIKLLCYSQDNETIKVEYQSVDTSLIKEYILKSGKNIIVEKDVPTDLNHIVITFKKSNKKTELKF